MNCLIYLRVSTTEQVEKGFNEEGYSIPAQREACERYIRDNGWNVIDEYVDRGESARSADRPQLQEMLSRVRKDPTIDAVVIHKIDRLARNVPDHVGIKAILKQHNVNLISVSENIEDSASGMLIEGIMAVIAEYYSANLGKEAQKGMLQKAKQGGWPQMAPIGYLNKKEIVNGREFSTIEVDPVRGPIIAEAFKMYSTGLYSLTKLHEKITAMGLKTRPTRKWPEQPISRSNLAFILQNKFYTGYFEWKDIEYKGNHEALIDLETYEKVQDVLLINRVGIKRRTHNHFLKGTVYCADCGRKLSINAIKKKDKKYLFYYCLGRKDKVKCEWPYIDFGKVEKGVEAYYQNIRMRDEWVEKIIDDYKQQMLNREEEDLKQHKLANKQIEKIKQEKIRLTKAYKAGAMDLDILKAENEELNKDLAAAQSLTNSITAKTEVIEKRLMTAIEIAKKCGIGYKTGTEETKAKLNQALFKKLYIDKFGNVVDAEFTPIFNSLFVKHEFELEQFGSPDRTIFELIERMCLYATA